MLRYVLHRVIAMIPVVIGITFLVYLIMSLAPGSPATLILGPEATPEAIAQWESENGLDAPVLVQYGRYMLNLLRGDLGISYANGRPVAAEVFTRFPATFKLAVAAAVLALVVAIPLGIIAAIKRNTLIDHASMVISLLGISMPTFWFALMMMLFFSLRLGLLPARGADDGWVSYILPTISVSFMNLAAIARTTRSSMLDAIHQDYVRTARAKGITSGKVYMHHAFRNALIPVITISGVQLGTLLGGAILTETVFSWPGLGRYMVQSVNARDTPAVIGCILVLAVGLSIINLLIDLVYGFVDPRLRSMYQSKAKIRR